MSMDLLRRHRNAFAVATALSVTFLAAVPAFAAIVPDCALVAGTNPPDLNCVLQTFAGIAQVILGVTGSAALLMFVYGGFVLLSSGGESSKVTTGKTILRNAIIGIFIIFASGYVVRYGLQQLQSSGSGEGQQVQFGTACGDDGKGRAFPGKEGQCFTSCGQFGNYSCKVPSKEQESGCFAGLCPEGGADVRCCPN